MKGTWRLARWLGVGVLALLVFAVFLIVSAPASMLARAVAHFSGNRVTLHQPTGSMWDGSAQLTAPILGPTPAGTLRWTIDRLPLLVGTLSVQLQLTGSEYEARGHVNAGLRRYTVRDLTLVAPARIMAQAYVPARLLAPTGRLRLTTPALDIGADGVHGTATLAWDEAGTGLPNLSQLGDYQVQANAQGERAELRVSTSKGMILANGEGDWRLLGDGLLRVQGTLRLSAPLPQVEAMLQALYPKQPDGSHAFNFETRLPLTPLLPR
jgi:hypothetical protein